MYPAEKSGQSRNSISLPERRAGSTTRKREQSGKGFRILLYSHDTLGLGHLHRNLKIARGLRSRFPELSLMLLTGSLQTVHYRLPRDVDYVKFPSVRKTEDEQYDSRFPGVEFARVRSLRSKIILETVKEYAPHVFLVDHAPLGMKGEILPSLRWLKENVAGSVAILGLRDIMDQPEKVIDRWREQGTYQVLRSLYDHIVVYGDPGLFDIVSLYNLEDDIAAKVHYVGYVTGHKVPISAERKARPVSQSPKLVLVTIGGGEWAGDIIIGNYLEMLRQNVQAVTFETVILTGPFLPDDLWRQFTRRARGLPVRLRHFVARPSRYLQKSDLIISTAGYNTMTDVLSYGARALIIPRIKFRDEQLLRARRLAERGLVDFMHPDDVTPERLYEAVSDGLANHENPLVQARLDRKLPLDGASRMAGFLANLLYQSSEIREAASC